MAVDLVPSQSGGSHERDRRAGTLNTPGIVGMAKALELAYAEFDAHTMHYQSLRDQLIDWRAQPRTGRAVDRTS